MRALIIAFCLVLCVNGISQTRQDSLQTLGQLVRLIDLEYTPQELDSMFDGARNYHSLFRAMHAYYPSNDLPYPFSFNPLPLGASLPVFPASAPLPQPAVIKMPKNKNELAYYSITQLAGLIRSGQITSLELTRFFLDRLKKYGDTLECVITLTEDLALQEARQADEEIKAGKYRGLLHGIPYGLKDLFAVKGYRTTWGSTPYKDQVIDQNAYVYEKLKAAGAVHCAKLSLGALAYDNKWFGGFTRNPWNLQQGSSGSSAGSAAATSAGLLPFTIGTETWGSIVSPSNRCGVTGLRPSFGRISRSGAMVLCWSLDKIGPICRSAEDAAIVFHFINGTDGRDAGAVDLPFPFYDPGASRKLRIAYAENYFKRLPAHAPEWKVVEKFREQGIRVEAVQFPDSSIYPFDIMNIVISAEAAAAFDPLTRNNQDDLIERQDRNFWPNIFRTARIIPAVEYINANRYRSRLSHDLHQFMQNYDVVIVPSFAGRQLAITNLTGHPVVVMPIGLNERKQPVSISLLGNLYREDQVLQAASFFQQLTDYHLMQPPAFRVKE